MTCSSDAPQGRVCTPSTTRPPSLGRENQVRRARGAAVPSRDSIIPSDRKDGSSPGYAGAEQGDGSFRQVAVGNRPGRAVGPVEVGEGGYRTLVPGASADALSLDLVSLAAASRHCYYCHAD
jgi:hypothetical protein